MKLEFNVEDLKTFINLAKENLSNVMKEVMTDFFEDNKDKIMESITKEKFICAKSEISEQERKNLQQLYYTDNKSWKEIELIDKIAYAVKKYFIERYNELHSYEIFYKQYEDIMQKPNVIPDFQSFTKIDENYLKPFYYQITNLYLKLRRENMVNDVEHIREVFVAVVLYVLDCVLDKRKLYQQIKDNA